SFHKNEQLNKLAKCNFKCSFANIGFRIILIVNVLNGFPNGLGRIVKNSFVCHLNASFHKISKYTSHPTIGNKIWNQTHSLISMLHNGTKKYFLICKGHIGSTRNDFQTTIDHLVYLLPGYQSGCSTRREYFS